MSTFAAGMLLAAAYLAGSIPFGFVLCWTKGVDLRKVGSGNIGATNTGRAIGRKYGILVFVLDFLKGALPVAAVPFFWTSLSGAGVPLDLLRVAVAACAFLGHLFPIYLGFKGGKGVATGAGAVMVLVPLAGSAAVVSWVLVVLTSRFVSLASIVAVLVLVFVHLSMHGHPFDDPHIYVTSFCVLTAILVIAKHYTNIQRLLNGTENAIQERPVQHKFLRILHVLALGIWVGGAGFFNLAVAPTNNRTFKEVVNTAPNERTAGLPLLTPESTQQDKDRLASALFGAAVGPVFPIYFLMQSLCGAVALVTAISWWGSDPTTRLHRGRVILISFTLLTVLVGWLISNHVTEIRQLRLSPNPQIAQQAQADFGSWHFVSLGLSLFTILCATVCLTLAALLPPLPTAKSAE